VLSGPVVVGGDVRGGLHDRGDGHGRFDADGDQRFREPPRVLIGEEEFAAKRAELFRDGRAEHESRVSDGDREIAARHDGAIDPGNLTGHRGARVSRTWSTRPRRLGVAKCDGTRMPPPCPLSLGVVSGEAGRIPSARASGFKGIGKTGGLRACRLALAWKPEARAEGDRVDSGDAGRIPSARASGFKGVATDHLTARLEGEPSGQVCRGHGGPPTT
jgi:hypothetical protein